MLRELNSPGRAPYAELEAFASAPAAQSLLQKAALAVAEGAFARAPSLDHDDAYPADDIVALHQSGLFAAALPPEFGGAGLTGEALNQVLQIIGFGSLALGRLFEGHVNAIQLVLRYGRPEQIRRTAEETLHGRLLGVWNTDDANKLRLIRDREGYRLAGRRFSRQGLAPSNGQS